jgi:hypothetical protein
MSVCVGLNPLVRFVRSTYEPYELILEHYEEEALSSLDLSSSSSTSYACFSLMSTFALVPPSETPELLSEELMLSDTGEYLPSLVIIL